MLVEVKREGASHFDIDGPVCPADRFINLFVILTFRIPSLYFVVYIAIISLCAMLDAVMLGQVGTLSQIQIIQEAHWQDHVLSTYLK